MQLLLATALVDFNYPGKLNMFLSLLLTIAEMDVIGGAQLAEENLDLKETPPFNERFLDTNTETMNLFYNTGSLPIFFVLIFVSHAFFGLLAKLSLCCYKSRMSRKFGVWA